MNLVIGGETLDQVIEHARVCYPQEGCGLLVGHGEEVKRFIPMLNSLRSSQEYEIDPRQLFDFFRTLRISGEQLVGIYHSHPVGAAYPSPRDIERAYYPECAYLIVSLVDPDHPAARAFRIVDGKVSEIEIHAVV